MLIWSSFLTSSNIRLGITSNFSLLRRPCQHCPGQERGNMYSQWWSDTVWSSHRWPGGSRDQFLGGGARELTALDPRRFCSDSNSRQCGASSALQQLRQSKDNFSDGSNDMVNNRQNELVNFMLSLETIIVNLLSSIFLPKCGHRMGCFST